MKAILVAVALSLLVGGVSGALVSRSLWGYWLRRPDVPREILKARRLVSLTPLRSVGKGDACRLEMDPKYSVERRMQWALDDPYYAHEGRLLLVLDARGMSPAAVGSDDDLRLSDLLEQLRASAIFAWGEVGYESAACLAGIAVEVGGDGGEPSLVVGLHGRQVSNDHYPYYEATFAREGSGWRLQRSQRYFYDVAGIEGLEAPQLAAIFSILAFWAVCCVAVVYSCARGLMAWSERRRRA